jgi:hypothetical protein
LQGASSLSGQFQHSPAGTIPGSQGGTTPAPTGICHSDSKPEPRCDDALAHGPRPGGPAASWCRRGLGSCRLAASTRAATAPSLAAKVGLAKVGLAMQRVRWAFHTSSASRARRGGPPQAVTARRRGRGRGAWRRAPGGSVRSGLKLGWQCQGPRRARGPAPGGGPLPPGAGRARPRGFRTDSEESRIRSHTARAGARARAGHAGHWQEHEPQDSKGGPGPACRPTGTARRAPSP